MVTHEELSKLQPGDRLRWLGKTPAQNEDATVRHMPKFWFDLGIIVQKDNGRIVFWKPGCPNSGLEILT